MDTKKLRQKILDLAIRGKLVPQDPNDEPASVLLERIRAEKERLIKEGKIKRIKKTASDDEIEAPFEIPESWEWCKLGNVIKLKSGECIKIRSLSGDSKYPVYGGNGINGFFDDYNVESETLIIGRVGFYCGSVHKTESKAWVTDNALIVTYDKTLFSIDYLRYAMLNLNLSTTSNSTAQPVVSGKGIYPLLVPIPPLAEQKRIANEVENLFSVIDFFDVNENDLLKTIDKAKSKILDLAIHGKLVPQDPNDEPAIELLKRINPKFEPIDSSKFGIEVPKGWCLTTIGQVCSFLSGYSYPSSDYKKFGIPLIRISNINDGVISLDDCVYIDPKGERHIFIQTGDILIAMSGATTGKMGVYTSDNPSILNQRVGVVRITDKRIISEKYRNCFMESQSDTILKLAYGGAQPNISGKMISSLLLPLPPLSEQNRIVAKIEDLFTVLDDIKGSIEN